jgi:hypothetical protein
LNKTRVGDRAERRETCYLSHTQRIEEMVSRRFKLSGWLARPCRALLTFAMLMAKRGRSSVVEHQLPKLSRDLL